MTREAYRRDIANDPDLLRLAEEVQRTGQRQLLTKGTAVLVAVVPLQVKRGHPGHRPPTEAQLAATLSAAGSWKSLIDAERLKRELKEARGDHRPLVSL